MAVPGLEAPMAEWPGAVSGKFTDKLHGRERSKMMVDAYAKSGAEQGLARNGFGAYFTDTSALAHQQQCKKSVPHLHNSEVFNWRPAKRVLSEPGCLHYEKPEGRRAPDGVPNSAVFTMREKRHIRQVESKEEYHDRPVGPKPVYRDNGFRAADQPAREVDIQTEMTRKARALDLYSQRNGVGCKSLGDKAYRHPEYNGDFYQVGGLIVGSTGIRGHYKRTEPRNSTTVHLVMDGTKKSVESYEEKYRKHLLREEQKEVEHLTREWEAGTLRDCEEARYEELDSDDEASPAAQGS